MYPGVLFASILLLASGVVPGAQTAQHQHPQPAAQQAAIPEMCKAMMAEHQRMTADMKTADARLDQLVSTMNAASGEAKVAAAAAAVTEIVAQRRAMHDGMMKMHQGMMGHIMEHMQAGPGSMAMCPMMKGQSGAH